MKLELSLRLATLALLAPLALAPLGCDGGDEGEDEVADTETTDADTTGADTETTGEPDLVNGQSVHDNSCAVAGCHGAADMVQLSERVPMLDDAGLEAQIRNGGNGMPGFNETLISPEDLVDLIAFLRATYG
jgi:mono/diheme cytochrome c family protein